MTPAQFYALRKHLHLTQRQLADLMGVNSRRIGELENGLSRHGIEYEAIPTLYERALRDVAREMQTASDEDPAKPDSEDR